MREKYENGNFFFNVLKGVGAMLIATLLGVLIFALIIKITVLSSGVIKAASQFLKILSVFIGCMAGINVKGGFSKGVLIGAFGTLLTYVLFSFFGTEITFGVSFIVDVIFLSVCGAIAGIIAVNVKK